MTMGEHERNERMMEEHHLPEVHRNYTHSHRRVIGTHALVPVVFVVSYSFDDNLYVDGMKLGEGSEWSWRYNRREEVGAEGRSGMRFPRSDCDDAWLLLSRALAGG
jgi:hypothetical protein